MRIRPRPLSWFAALALMALPSVASAGDVNQAKTVIELFTSQGCSSCPKADKLLGEFAADPRFIALTLSVDYWDYLGWRDTLALHAHSVRQKGYATSRGDRQVYTPQAVLNGVTEAIGNKRTAIEQAAKHVEKTSPAIVPISLKRNDAQLEVEVGAGAGTPASVWLVPVLKRAPIAIERGENRGKTIMYHNVVRGWSKIADWSGTTLRKSHPIADLAQSGADALVVILQNGTADVPGAIRGAGMIDLH